MASLLFAFCHIQHIGDIGQVGEFENRDAERASARTGAAKTADDSFCLLVCCLFRAVSLPRRLGT